MILLLSLSPDDILRYHSAYEEFTSIIYTLIKCRFDAAPVLLLAEACELPVPWLTDARSGRSAINRRDRSELLLADALQWAELSSTPLGSCDFALAARYMNGAGQYNLPGWVTVTVSFSNTAGRDAKIPWEE